MKSALVLGLLLLTACFAATAAAKDLLFTHSGHPAAKTILIPLLQDVYAELGYTLTFQETEGVRALKLLNDDLVDGDVGRLEPLLQGLDSAVPVVLMDTVHIVLYCRSGLTCDNAVLQNPKVRILIPTHDATLKLLTNDIAAKLYFNNDWHNIITMFNAGKVDYLLWVDSRLMKAPTLAGASKTSTSIGPFRMYHLLHKQHQGLAEQVAKRLSQRLAKADAQAAAGQ